ncbi:MarR family transcriptional regulator [Microbacterium sp. NEAU-LLC]|uniref:MarR family transcriptional regulator n=1 Tax=Microbacterium helvum TaxID=2773713 RepID=A0ABR8NQW2_9MICO|nr:MarR family transcriptional regulator [Microbacterium helvum]MBD3943030.1 MarR family transcriptional regulator [Microbacterium helvum]
MDEIERDPRGEPATERLNYTAYRLGRAFNRVAENIALAHGVTLSQFFVLQVLGEGVPLSNAGLARRTFVSAQAAHTVSNELIEVGLVERHDHPTNRRVRLVRLTEQGWDVLALCRHELRAHEVALVDALGDELGDSLVGILDRTAGILAGGYFGDDAAEAAAILKRTNSIRPRHIPSRLAAAHLRAARAEDPAD